MKQSPEESNPADSLPPRNHNAPKRSAIGEWYFQRDEWMRDVSECQELTAVERLVGLHLALRVNRIQQEATHQQSTLAEQLGLAVHTVKMALRSLREKEFIWVEQGRRGVKKRAVNRYSLMYKWQRSKVL